MTSTNHEQTSLVRPFAVAEGVDNSPWGWEPDRGVLIPGPWLASGQAKAPLGFGRWVSLGFPLPWGGRVVDRLARGGPDRSRGWTARSPVPL